MKSNPGFYYLATPYAKYPNGTEQAHADAVYNASILLRAGIKVFCPIAHTHHMSLFYTPPDPHRFWLDFDLAFMRVSLGLIVCKLPSWEESRGIAEETKYFAAAGLPIVYMEPGIIPVEFH